MIDDIEGFPETNKDTRTVWISRSETLVNPKDIHITCDGTVMNTHVYIDGNELEGVKLISIVGSVFDKFKPVMVQVNRIFQTKFREPIKIIGYYFGRAYTTEDQKEDSYLMNLIQSSPYWTWALRVNEEQLKHDDWVLNHPDVM